MDTLQSALLDSSKLFVYGTLKRGYSNFGAHLERAKFIGEDSQMEGVLFALSGFPGLNLTEPRTKIHGEIFEVSGDQLSSCDRLEGHPGFYRRSLVYLKPHGLVWTYILPRTRCQTIPRWVPSGNWLGTETVVEPWQGFTPKFVEGKVLAPEDADKFWKIPAEAYPGFHYVVNIRTREVFGPWRQIGETADGKPKVEYPNRRNILTAVKELITPVPPGPHRPPSILPAPVPIGRIIKQQKPESLAGPGLEEV